MSKHPESIKKEIAEFNKTLRHDLREAYGLTQGFMNVIESEYKDILEEDGKKMIDFAQGSLKKMDLLIKNQIYFQTMLFQDIELEKICLKNFIDYIKMDNALEIEIINEIEPNLDIFSSREYLSFIFKELIQNAYRFNTSENKRIILSSKSSDDIIQVHCLDNGLGLDEKSTHQLFEFGHKVYKDPSIEKSLGYGLGQCKTLMKLLKHKIYINNDEADKFIICEFKKFNSQMLN